MAKKKGYDIFDFDGTGMLEIEKIDEENVFTDDEEAVEQAIKDGIKIIPCNYDEVVPHIFVIRVTNGKRDEVKQFLNDNGVATGMHYRPNHLLSLFAGNQDNATLKHTDEIYEQLITLPLHADMSEEDVKYVCETIKKSI